MLNTLEISRLLSSSHLNGWLLTDYQKTNSPARELLTIPDHLPASRRWFFLIPASNTPPVKLVHAIEPSILQHLPGETRTYTGRESLIAELKRILPPNSIIAMEYSPLAQIPNASRVDAGTIELIRSLNVSVVSSANLLQAVTARWGISGLTSHRMAANSLIAITHDVWRFIRASLDGSPVTELDVRNVILSRFDSLGLTTDHPPICAVNDHASDPHFEPTIENTRTIERNNLILIDLWAKTREPDAVFADITWTAFSGESVPDDIAHVASIVFNARNTALHHIQSHWHLSGTLTGAEVDGICRGVINDAGFGDRFIHRTGHSLGRSVHGPGANLDGLESVDTRHLIADTGFTIEPGIYLPERFGIRSEINVALTSDGQVEITTLPLQDQVIPLI